MKTYGAISIDAESVKLKIVEKNKNGFRILEDLSVKINLGIDLLNKNKILRSSVEELTECLKKFKHILKEYEVKSFRIVATGIIRKAPNGKFVIGLISKKLKLKIDILEEPVERFFTYLSLNKKMNNYKKIKNEGLIFVEVGSTSSELIVFRKSKIIISSQIPVGVMKLKSLILSTSRLTGNTEELLSDYVSGMIENLDKYISRKKINHYIAYGTNLYKLLEVTGQKSDGVDKKLFDEITKKIYDHDVDFKDKIEKHHIDYNGLLCELIILNHFYKGITDADIYVPDISLRDGIIYGIVEEIDKFNRNSDITQDIISCARQVSKKYNSTAKHTNRIENNFIKLFDVYKEDENFTEKDLMIGRMVCFLHETGKFSRQIDYYEASYRNILNANLLGIDNELLNEIAETTLHFFYFSKQVILKQDFSNSENKRIKLALLIALSEATDKSKKQNMQLIKPAVVGDELRLEVSKNGKCYLEIWEINRMKDYFLDVFGHEIIIKH